MKKGVAVLVFIFLLIASLLIAHSSFVFAESCSTSCPDNNLDKCIAECQKLIDISVNQNLEKEIANLDANSKSLGILIEKKKMIINADEQKFAARQKLLNSQLRDFYKKNWTTPLEYFLTTVLSGDQVGNTLHALAYRQQLINQERTLITSLVLEISDLNGQKKKLEETQNWLADKQKDLEIILAPIKKLVAESKAYQSQLNQTVGTLSSRQQELIAQKIGSLNLSRSAGISMACSDDRNIDPGFSPRFAFYTFGIPHRVGMSQFGAYGRAKNGQNYQDILRAYYSGISFENGKENISIKIQGNGEKPLDEYLLGIYEMPESWDINALKAQAVAARSYALAYTNNGQREICTTQDCQVWKSDKKTGQWKQAVEQTKGEVMTNGGQIIKAWYSSTDGGYTHSSADIFGGGTAWTKNFRDTNGDINSISDLFSKAYDRDSPCFYNAQGWRTQYNKSAWLKSEEVADIVNVILLSAKTSNWDSWDAERVKQELGSGAFNRIDSISMNFDLGYGRTTSVTVSGDAGSKTFDGKTFKDYFNVRAPANIAIVGPLFNIEKK
ncbi:SpoIID/LytB domain-containing protein [Candidatus Gottesmanbacteria bacterium]|nr:SpoIID/LytB domain-containing protein [Candidatus Gottesmanbacteria bacterium]